MKLRALMLLVGLVGCKPEIEPGPFLCAKNTECSTDWFCALDRHCHQRSKGESLDCVTSADCGGMWFCGSDKRCHKCHPAVDAGAIPCAYAADFADCTDGWRCSFGGTCLDPAGEGLEPTTRKLAAPELIRNVLPASPIAALSPSGHSSTRPAFEPMAIATLDDAGLRLFQRGQTPPLMMQPTKPEHFTSYDFRVRTFPLSGIVSAPIAADVEAVVFFHNGTLSQVRGFLDGGSVAATAVLTGDGGPLVLGGSGPRSVTELRQLSYGKLAAFRPGGNGYWELGSTPAQWVARLGFVDVVDVPLSPPDDCRLEGIASGQAINFAADSGSDCQLNEAADAAVVG